MKIIGSCAYPSMKTLIFAPVVAVLLALFAYAPRAVTATDLLLLCGFLWLAWSGQRYVIWYGAVVLPILAQVPLTLPPSKEW